MKFLSYGVMIYMLMALIWWSVLLTKNNSALHLKNMELLIVKKTTDIRTPDNDKKFQSDLLKIEQDYKKKKYMILGEGMVFGISLILGMWFIQRAYNRELENSRKQKNFLMSVTHELKSPVASISLISETLLKRKLSPEKVNELHSSILSESQRLEKLISNLLLASRINNAYPYNFEDVEIKELIVKVVKFMQLNYPDVHIAVDIPTSPIQVQADKESLVSVFTNLLENSIKYSLTPAQIRITLSESAKNVKIVFSDLGFGIPDSEKEKVIQQFYRIGNEETRQTKGTGLGLYIVHKIIEAHRGKLKITDNKPTGTTFTVVLPLKQHY